MGCCSTRRWVSFVPLRRTASPRGVQAHRGAHAEQNANLRPLHCVQPALQADKELVLVAVRQNGWALEWCVTLHTQSLPPCSTCSRSTRVGPLCVNGVCVPCARKSGRASANLQGDRAVVLAAVTQCGWALQFASAQLRGERALVLAGTLLACVTAVLNLRQLHLYMFL